MNRLFPGRSCNSVLPAWRLPAVCHSRLALSQSRNYARRRPSPVFDASGPTATKSQHEPKLSEQPEAGRGRRGFRIGPGKAILFSIVVFISYRVYTWQTNPRRSVILNPQFFTPFILEHKEEVSSTSSVLNLLSVPQGQNIDNVSEAWKSGVWSVQVMQPELQIARSYTPLPPENDSPDEQVRLFVRKEPQGEVSGYLHRIALGTLVHLRGPRLEYQIPENVDEVLFLAGGTGIAPALQVAHTLYRARSSTENVPTMRILWANRRREDSFAGLGAFQATPGQIFRAGIMAKVRNALISMEHGPAKIDIKLQSENTPGSNRQQSRLVEEVELLKGKYNDKVKIDYFVDEDKSYISEDLLRAHLSVDETSSKPNGSPRRRLLLVAGPEGFVESLAGPKEWQGGKEVQGSLGGVLNKIRPRGWEIWKL